MKKYLSFILAVLLIMGVLAGCAEQGNTPAPANSSTPVHTQATLPTDSAFTNEEYEKLLALRFDGYEEMTVAEFRDKVMASMDTKEYIALFDRLSESTTLQDLKDTDEAAAFIFYTLMPLTDDTWQVKSFNGAATTDVDTSAMLEYSYTLTIADENTLTVREYNDTQTGIANGLQTFLDGKTAVELQNETEMQTAIGNEVATLTELWGTEKLNVEVECVFRCENPLQHGDSHTSNPPISDTEPRRAEHGTKEDYQSLLALKTTDYANMSVADFNAKLLAWADEDFSRMERIDADTLCNDFQVNLSEEERDFVRLTVFLSGIENGELVQSNFTNGPVADPAYQESLPQKTDMSNDKSPLWCDFGYQFSYHIANSETLTVDERDRSIGGMMNAVEKFWNEMTLDELLTMTKSDMISRLTTLAAEYSTDGIVITINTEKIHFEHTEETPEEPLA